MAQDHAQWQCDDPVHFGRDFEAFERKSCTGPHRTIIRPSNGKTYVVHDRGKDDEKYLLWAIEKREFLAASKIADEKLAAQRLAARQVDRRARDEYLAQRPAKTSQRPAVSGSATGKTQATIAAPLELLPADEEKGVPTNSTVKRANLDKPLPQVSLPKQAGDSAASKATAVVKQNEDKQDIEEDFDVISAAEVEEALDAEWVM